MNWSALTKKQQQMTVATVVLAVAQIALMAHLLGWTKPASSRGGSTKTELLELEQKIEEARIILKREEMIRSELSLSVEELEKLAGYVPSRSDRYAWAYEYVSRCATLAKVDLDNLEEVVFMSADKKDVAHPYEISVSTRCGYNSLIGFLWRLERGNPLLRIKEVTVSAVSGLSQSHQVRVVMQWPAAVKIEKGM